MQYPTNEMMLSKIKPNAFFRRKADSKKIYVKSYYDKKTKSFECYDAEDVMSTIYIKATKIVFVNFDY